MYNIEAKHFRKEVLLLRKGLAEGKLFIQIPRSQQLKIKMNKKTKKVF